MERVRLMKITNETKEILEMANSLPKKEISMVKAFIAGLEAKDKLKEEHKAAG